jgi:hypothetical protein
MANINAVQGKTELYKGTGAADNDLLFTTANVQIYGSYTLMSTAGAVDVEVTLDGATWSTAALALEDAGSATNTTYVLVTTALRVYRFRGKYTQVRVRQNGATAATAHLLCGIE